MKRRAFLGMGEAIKTYTKPICQADLERLVDRLYRKRTPLPHTGPKVEVRKLMEHGIGFHMESDDLVLVSSDGMRRAKEVGAIIPS